MERKELLLKRIAIIGGGLGGLSAAITLASKGFKVQVFEKNDHFGGKMMSVDIDNYHFDFGPNTITMPHVFENILKEAHLNPEEYFTFKQIETHTRNSYEDGVHFDLSTSSKLMVQQLKQIDPMGASNYPLFLKKIFHLYQLSQKHFLHRTFKSWKDYLSPELGSALLKVKPNQSLHQFFSQHFQNPRVIQAFDRYSTYIGSNPYTAPATFAMIAYLELVDGVYYTNGGNTNIAKGFMKAAQELGVELLPDHEVTKIDVNDQIAKTLEVNGNLHYEVDEVILNGDLLSAYPKLVSEEHRPRFSNKRANDFEASTSGFVILAALEGRIDGLHHHHVFFSNHYEKEFKQLQNGEYAEEPTIYICTSSKVDPEVSPDGDNCFILVNAPATDKEKKSVIDPDQYKEMIYERLKKFGIDIKPILKHEQIWTPSDLEKKFGAYKGSIYGPAANRRKDAFIRPFNQSQDISNLYFAGGSTHPGGGSPMVVLSGKNVANEIIKKHKKV